MWTRREVVGGTLAILFGGPACDACAQSMRHQATLGCTIGDDHLSRIYPAGTDTRLYATGNEPMIPGSGDKYFDYALAQTLYRVSELFSVLPGFAYYNDGNDHNAYATERRRMRQADGTVLFGLNFLKKLLKAPESPDAAAAAVAVHEFAHIYQFKHDLDDLLRRNQSTVKRVELQADFLAGYYAGIRKRQRPSFPAAVFATTQYGMGDHETEAQNHHGTAEERAGAIIRGFEASYRENKNLNDAVQASIAYVQTL